LSVVVVVVVVVVGGGGGGGRELQLMFLPLFVFFLLQPCK
jgi:hypothetical protein